MLMKFWTCLFREVNASFPLHGCKDVRHRKVWYRRGGSVELPLSMALLTFQLLLGPWQGTEMVGGVELPLSTAVVTLQPPVGQWSCVSFLKRTLMCLYKLQHSLTGEGGRGPEWARVIWLCLCPRLWLSKTGESINRAATLCHDGQSFPLCPQLSQFMSRLSTSCLPDNQETPVLSWSCHQLHCNRGHHQHSAHVDMASTFLGLVPGTHVGPSPHPPGEKVWSCLCPGLWGASSSL